MGIVDIGRENHSSALKVSNSMSASGASKVGGETFLEDHPRTCKWLITMAIVSPLTGVVPFTNGLFMACKWW